MTTKTKKQTKKPFAVSVPSEDHYDAWEVLINGTKQRVARISAEEINAAAEAWHAEWCAACPHVKAEKKLLAEFCEETSGLGDFRESKPSATRGTKLEPFAEVVPVKDIDSLYQIINGPSIIAVMRAPRRVVDKRVKIINAAAEAWHADRCREYDACLEVANTMLQKIVRKFSTIVETSGLGDFREDKRKPMTVGTWQRMLGESRQEIRAKKPKRVHGTKPKARRTR